MRERVERGFFNLIKTGRNHGQQRESNGGEIKKNLSILHIMLYKDSTSRWERLTFEIFGRTSDLHMVLLKHCLLELPLSSPPSTTRMFFPFSSKL